MVAFPIFYELEIPASISPASTYLLIAQVRNGDRLLFTNDVRVPVQTDAESSVEINIPVINVNIGLNFLIRKNRFFFNYLIDEATRQRMKEMAAHSWPHLLGRNGDEAVKFIKENSGE